MGLIRARTRAIGLIGVSGILTLALGGCGDSDQTEVKPVQSAEAKQKFEDTIKGAVKSGQYGPQQSKKP
jgi:hypothetical protein